MASVPLEKVLEFMQVLWALDHALQERSKAMAARIGVTSPQRLALRIIHNQPGISSGEVADKLFLDPSTLTGVLQRLEARGLLTRKKDKEDARRSLLQTTAAGETLLGQAEHTVEAVVREALESEKGKAVRKASAVLEHITARLKGAPAPEKTRKKVKPARRAAASTRASSSAGRT
jgi:DNA-binding MarR family transcriptional regulator